MTSSDLFDNSPLFGEYKNTGKSKPRCHTTHNPIKLGNGEILGAACGYPRKGYDIYIGFDYGMRYQHHTYPWELSPHTDPVIEFEYPITDMCAPKSPKDFKAMINWCANQLDDGKNIHVGCIGGHGRTGTFLAALVSLYPDLTDDPIKWVRENHCKKGVESKSQVKFLVKHFGCKTGKPTKGYETYQGAVKGPWKDKGYDDWDKNGTVPRLPVKGLGEKIRYIAKKGSIWG